jgi:hypothetical protein
MSRKSEYLAWLQPKMSEYAELMTKYKALKEKECAVGNQSSSKQQKRDILLLRRRNNTITQEESTELEYFEKEDGIDTMWDTHIERSKKVMEKAIEDAKSTYISSVEYFETQKKFQKTKLNTRYSAKKRLLEDRKKFIEQERSISVKTVAEITVEQAKLKVLQDMQKLIGLIEYAKKSTLKESEMEDAPSIPVLPEPIMTQFTPPAPIPVPVTPAPTPAVKYDYSMLGEDPATVALRQEMLSKRREKEREEEARWREENANRPPTQYGPIHVLEGRPAVKHTYVAPVIEDEPEEKILNDFFTRSPTSDDES